jgi:amino acid transporter
VLVVDTTYIGFYRGLKAQRIDRTKFAYYSPLQPFLAIWGTFWLTILILINGFDGFWSFTASGFLTSYINIPLAIALFVGWKVVKRTRWWRPDEMDFVTGIPTVGETDRPKPPPKTLLARIADKLF